MSIEQIAPIALGLMAAAVQDLYDVQRPNLSPSPTSLFVAVIAGTGEGKDAGAAPWLRPFLKFQSQADQEYEEHRRVYEVNLLEWKAGERVLLSELEQCLRDGEEGDWRTMLDRQIAGAARPISLLT